MRTVSVTELKAQLAKYLRQVRRGGEVEVLERGVPIARLVGVGSSVDEPAQLERLVRAGIMRRGTGDLSWVLEEAPIAASASVLEALSDDREDRT